MSRSSSTRYVLLTGKPGIGKSTLVKKVCEELAKKGISTSGFYTEEVRHSNGGGRIGFDVVTLSGSRAALARVSDSNAGRQPRVGATLHTRGYWTGERWLERRALPYILL